MKIGTITWFKDLNYGTILQAMALQEYLKNQNLDSYLIDYYIPHNHKPTFKLKNLLNKILYFTKKDFINSYNKKRLYSFNNFISLNCKITKPAISSNQYIKLCNDFDVLIFGSDQIWNPNWYHPFYFGNFSKINTKLLAYAPSFGVDKLPSNYSKTYKTALSRFTKIGLREQSGIKIAEKITAQKPTLVSDPTLLLDKNDWEKFEEDIPKITRQSYLLCYFLSYNKNHWHAAQQYAKKHHLKLVIIPTDTHSFFQKGIIPPTLTVGNFLSLIRHAEIIFTDSFHGTIFSLIYQKQLAIFERHQQTNQKSQNTRIYGILQTINKENILQKYNTSVINGNLKKNNYKIINKRLTALIESSEKFLQQSLQEFNHEQ